LFFSLFPISLRISHLFFTKDVRAREWGGYELTSSDTPREM
jgi:hypothetical protein